MTITADKARELAIDTPTHMEDIFKEIERCARLGNLSSTIYVSDYPNLMPEQIQYTLAQQGFTSTLKGSHGEYLRISWEL
jgi:hypothetical protein